MHNTAMFVRKHPFACIYVIMRRLVCSMIFILRRIATSSKAKKLAFVLFAIFAWNVYSNLMPHIKVLCYIYTYNQRLNVSQFVSFQGIDLYKWGRIGNQLFFLAAVIYVSNVMGRRPVLRNSTDLLLEDIFQLTFERFDDICPCFVLDENRGLSYDKDTDSKVVNGWLLSRQSILVGGFRQSWKYTIGIERRLRRLLIFKENIQNATEMFLEDSVPSGWKQAAFVRVGVHVRRGDILTPRFKNYGYTVPNDTYFQSAMGYFVKKYGRVQFIVASDDFNWTREHIVIDRYSPDAVNITYSFNHTAGVDLALLSMCDHVIMSTGTFGWWAAWLANGTTIYYRDWPLEGSELDKEFNREDFFPPNWIPMSDTKNDINGTYARD